MQFLAYIGTHSKAEEALRRAARHYWDEIDRREFSSGVLLQPSKFGSARGIVTTSGACIISGWMGVRSATGEMDASDDAVLRVMRTTHEADDGWPVAAHVTGDFSGVYADEHDVTLCTGPHSIQPLYYCEHPTGLYIGTNMLPIARALGLDIDQVGVAQRITPPFVHYGQRTLFKTLKRVVPGEARRYRHGTYVASRYDNSLLNHDVAINHVDAAEEYFTILCEDATACISGASSVAMAMSGGWDSRLQIAALSKVYAGRFTFFTYGTSRQAYEVRIAERLAETLDADFEYCDFSDSYFPSRQLLDESLMKTESVHFGQWFSVRAALRDREPASTIFFGDLFEAVPGRKLKHMYSRTARKSNFLKDLLGVPRPTSPFSAVDFRRWMEVEEDRVVREQLRAFSTNVQPDQNLMDPANLEEELRLDLRSTRDRIINHAHPLLDNAIELYYWYVNVMQDMARQMIILSDVSRPVSSAQSLRALRYMSRVSISDRVSGRFQYAINARCIPSRLARIPTVQIPWISGRAPRPMRQLMWGARSLLDQKLIRRAVRHKDPAMRQRLLVGIDFTRLYNTAAAGEHVKSWFESLLSHEEYVRTHMQRAALESWPMINADILVPGACDRMVALAQES